MNTFRLITVVWIMVSTFGLISQVPGEDSWQSLVHLVPADANALVMINVDQVRGSQFTKTAGWNANDRTEGGLRSLLPRDEIQRCVFAARLNLVDLSPQWEVGVLETKSDPSLALFAGGIPGPRETLGAVPSVRLPFDMYLVKLAPRLFGMMGPADRQKAARWGRLVQSSRPLDSAYLTKISASSEPDRKEIVIAFDLTDAIEPATVRTNMADSAVLLQAQIDAGTAAQIAATVQGVVLEIRVVDQVTGKLRIEFERDPAPLAKVMKPLLLERLAARGAMIEEFNSWTAELNGNIASLSGALTPQGLSRVLSIVEPTLPASDPALSAKQPAISSTPTLPKPMPTAPVETPVTPTAPKAQAESSRQHFVKVKALVTEVRFPGSDLKINSASAFGVWIDRQARRIDQLPVLDVDPDLLDWSQGVAKSLRVSAGKLRGANIRASVYSSNYYAYNDSGYAVQGGYYSGTTLQSPKQIQSRMETAAANLQHVDVMRMIDDEMASVRRMMSDRYRIEF